MTSAFRSWGGTEGRDLLGPLVKTERRATYADGVVGAAKYLCLIYKLSDNKSRMLNR